ncbi:putative membrane protein (plasmid) [Gordonia sp. KTR9]|nr:putative membrane protein [Gordonia sp. KTR9]
MLTTNNSDHTGTDWFDTVPAWASTGETPAQDMADELIAAGLVGPREGQPATARQSGDEWGWLGIPAAEPVPAPEAVEPSGEIYAEPELEGLAEPQASAEVFEAPVTAAPPRPRASRRVLIAAVVVVVVAVGAGMTFVSSVFDGATEGDAPRDPVAVLGGGVSSSASPPVVDECPEKTAGPVTVGNDAGDQRSGPGVIKAFDYAYYVRRSGAQARAVATPNGVGATQALQASIDALPAETRHCLRITDRGNGLFAVQLTQISPDGGQPTVYPQLIQTVQAGGKTWIASIRKDTA